MSMGPATNWAGNVTFDATRVHRPDSFDKLQRLVEASPLIRALGTAHSFSDIAVTSGDLARLDQTPGRVEIGPGGRTATVHAGMTYSPCLFRAPTRPLSRYGPIGGRS